MLDMCKYFVVFQDQNKWDGAKHRQNTRGKPASVGFTTDTGRGIHLSAGH
jgi:hypothetical protein